MKKTKVFDKITGKIVDQVDVNIIFGHSDTARFFMSMQSDDELEMLMKTQTDNQNFECCKIIQQEMESRKRK